MIPSKLVEAIRDAQHVCVVTGAGISAESGIPTFREAQQGLWEKHRPEDLATPEAFSRDPDFVWQWYRWRRQLVSKVAPNAAHVAIASLADTVKTLTLITQNVDGLHQRAGSRDVIEFHGNLFVNRCFVEGVIVDVDDDIETAPYCPACAARVRPGVVWFGEGIPADAIQRSLAAAAGCDVFLAVGTSSQVYPAAGLAELAQDNGACAAEFNLEPTPLSSQFDHCVIGKAGTTLPELVELVS
ncbi:MAG: NAD-dependent deacylase [Pseudomonadota bacterium]